MLSMQKQAMRLPPSRGVLVVLLPAFPELQEVEHTVLDKVVLVTRPEAEECSIQPKLGAGGIGV